MAETSMSNLTAVKKALTRFPRATKLLRLAVQEGQVLQVLGTWDRDEVKPQLAQEIIELLDAQALAAEQVVVASLMFVGEENAILASRAVRRAPVRVQDEMATHGLALSGSSTDQAAQAQRHLEIMMRLHFQSVSSALQQLTAISREALGLATRLSNRAEESEAEAARLRRQLARLPEQTDTDDEAGPAEQILQLANMALPLLNKPKPSASPPPTPPANGAPKA